MSRVLIYDIENMGVCGWAWGLYEQNLIHIEHPQHLLTIAWKWLDEKKVHTVALPDYKLYKTEPHNDRELAKEFWEVINQADVVIGHNCVEVSTPVLTTDLKWVKAGDLNEGDELVGFDEGMKPDESFRDENKNWRGIGDINAVRRIKPTTVTHHHIEKRKCLEVVLSNGDRIITTPEHPWLARTEKDNFYKWIRTEKMRPGIRITKFWDVWQEDNSYEAGWLSGFIAGEGTLKQSGKSFGVDFYQRPGSTWNQALSYCDQLDLPVSPDRTMRATGIGRQDTLCTGFTGGKFRIAQIIGRLQIKRFIDKLSWDTFGGLKGHNLDVLTVVEVNDAGEREVAIMGTSTKTYFAGGYAMHNSDQFDNKMVNAMFMRHKLPPPTPYKTVDTKKVAKSNARFISNKLDDLGEEFQIGKKLKHEGFSLWLGCDNGDMKCWKKMLKYNKQDVKLTEKLYLELRPWVKNHPAMNVLDSRPETCPKCGGGPMIAGTKYTPTNANIYQFYHCRACGGSAKARLPEYKQAGERMRFTN